MLVLSRRKDESIHIGDDVVINVAQICKSHVKLTIDAPRHVPVYRSELRRRRTDTAPAAGAVRRSPSRRAGVCLASLPRHACSQQPPEKVPRIPDA